MRAGFCAFSPEFKERVKEIRSKLGIPQGGFPKEVHTVLGPPEKGFPKEESFYPKEAIRRWYVEHVQKTVGNVQYKDLPHYYWYFPKDFAELIDNFAYTGQPCRPGFHPEVPLDRYAMDLVQEFGLPEDFVNEVKRHILTEESSSFGVSPMLQPIIIPMDGQDGLYFCALIAGIDGSTTKKEWLDIWQEIKRQMQWKGIKAVPTKRDEEKIEIRDLTWWKWSKDGLSPKDIANKWEEGRAGEVYGEDTVRAAVKKMEKIMRPIPQNES
jgi:hypothetical protein